MFHLPARTNSPFLVAVTAGPTAGPLEVTVTAPETSTTVVALTLTGDSWTGSWTPAAPGDHVVAITTADGDPTLLGSQFTVNVSDLTLGLLWGDHTDSSLGCGGSQRLIWPAPDLPTLPCIEQWTAPQIRKWTLVATNQLFGDTAFRFPGCHRYARLQPNVTSSCLTLTSKGVRGFDLFPSLHYPAIELLEVEINGTPADLADWAIYENRWLVPSPGVPWPSQYIGGTTENTWSILVRYGRRPPELLVMARDRWMVSMLTSVEPTTGGKLVCQLPDGVTQISENGRTMTLTQEQATMSAATLVEQAVKRWGPKASDSSGIIDPAEITARGSTYARRLPGDQIPEDHLLFIQSGPDLVAELAALVGP